jgi:hypothetical protein
MKIIVIAIIITIVNSSFNPDDGVGENEYVESFPEFELFVRNEIKEKRSKMTNADEYIKKCIIYSQK